MSHIEPGDRVIATKLNDDESEAVVAAVLETTVDDYNFDSGRGDTNLYEYWKGMNISTHERVVEIRYVKGVDWAGDPVSYSKQTYAFPESRIAKIDGGDQ
jgi:hypothetical protein